MRLPSYKTTSINSVECLTEREFVTWLRDHKGAIVEVSTSETFISGIMQPGGQFKSSNYLSTAGIKCTYKELIWLKELDGKWHKK